MVQSAMRQVSQPSDMTMVRKPRVRFYTVPSRVMWKRSQPKMSIGPYLHQVVYQPNERPWTLKPVYGTYSQQTRARKTQYTKMMNAKRSETVLKNLAEELLNSEECRLFKQALHHFRVTNSVTTLCQQLKTVINTTPKILLLVELSNRMPHGLQEDFHRLCSLQFPNYDTYLKLFMKTNSSNDNPKVIARDSSGRIKIIAQGSEKKMMVRYNNQKQSYELRSLPGTSVTSGIYSNGSDSDNDDVFEDVDSPQDNQGRATPVHLEGKQNVHKVFLNRHEDGSLGLGITGGKEQGSEIKINVVEEGGPAATQGLQIGDRILEVNGHNFHNITHAEAVMIMRNAWNLIILVERPLQQPTDQDVADMVARDHEIQDLELIVFPSHMGKLGCVSQRLPSQDLIVMSVEENSAAFKAGVRSHDLIYRIDGISVRELSEPQIVMLTNAKRISLSVKRYVAFSFHDTVDGVSRMPSEFRSRSASAVRHEQTTSPRSPSSPRSDGSRNHSADMRQTTHYVVSRENTRPVTGQTARVIRRTVNNKPEHLVYGNKQNKEANWIISPKPREHRYTQRKDVYRDSNVNSHSYPLHVRSRSEESTRHFVSTGKEGYVNGGRVSRYVQNRSHSPHRNTITRVHNEDNVIRAIQVGLEKRQRAVRHSNYQMHDPADFEWEI